MIIDHTISVFSEVLQFDVDAEHTMAATAESSEARPEPVATLATQMDTSTLKSAMNEEDKSPSPLVINADFKDSPRNRSVSLDNQKNSEEIVRDELNNSNSESTTKVLSKAMNALVRQDMDTVTPPRKAKIKTPVKKKTNLFRPYDLEDKRKVVPSESPMLLRANYGGRSHTTSWQIEKRSKAETVMPYLQSNDKEVSENKYHIQYENENPFSISGTSSTQDKDMVTGVVNSNLSGMHTGRETSQSKSNDACPIPSHSYLPLLASTPKRAPSLPVVEQTFRSDGRISELSAKQSNLEKTVDNACESDTVMSKIVEESNTDQGHLPKVSASKQLDSMCQKISAVMGRLAEGFRNQKHYEVLGQTVADQTLRSATSVQNETTTTATSQAPATTVSELPRPGSSSQAPATTVSELPRPGSSSQAPATTVSELPRPGSSSQAPATTVSELPRPGSSSQAPATTVSELPRPGSCPPRMVNPTSVDNSRAQNMPKSGSLLMSTDSMKQSWAKHHSTTAGILSTSDSGKTVLPSFATFTNKQFQPEFQPQPLRKSRDESSRTSQAATDCPWRKESYSQHVPIPRSMRYPHHNLSSQEETANERVKSELKDSVSMIMAEPSALKRPFPFLDADTYVTNNKVAKRHSRDSNVENLHAQQMDKDVQAMRIPLRPPLPSPRTGLIADSYRSSHRNLAGNFLPYSVPSSHMNKTFTAPFQSSQVYTSSHNMHKMHAIYSGDKKNFENETTVDDVRKKLDLNLESGKTNNFQTDRNRSYQNVRDSSLNINDSLRFGEQKTHQFAINVHEKNLRNLQERVITNSEETKGVDRPKYIISNTQNSAFGEIHPRYDTENMASYGFISKVDKHNNFPSPNLSRRPLGVSVLQNQVLGQSQRHSDPRMESQVPDSRPKPFSVRRPQESAFLAESKRPTHHYLPSETLMRSATPTFAPGPFTTPVRPLRQPSFTPVPTMRPPTPTFGPQYRPMAGQVEPLSPVPVAEKIPMAALLMMMKVNTVFMYNMYCIHRNYKVFKLSESALSTGIKFSE